MSVFEIFDEAADLPRLAAALTMITRVQPFYGVIIPRRAITDCQYVVQRSDGNIFDSKMVKRHWDLTKGPKGNTQQLAERIARCREVNYTGQQIIEYINDEMTNGRLHRNDVFRLTAKLDAGSIMVAHWRSLHLHLRHA